MKKYVQFGLLWGVLWVIFTTAAYAWNTNVWLLILWTWEVLSGSTSSYFPTNTWSVSTGSTNTWTVHTGTNNGGWWWGGWGGSWVGSNTETPIIPIIPIVPMPNVGVTWIVIPIQTWVVLWVDPNDQNLLPAAPLQIDPEVYNAYVWAKEYEITTISTREKARLDQPLLRSELAKMMVTFGTKLMWKIITPNPSCTIDSFKDAYQFDSEERKFIKQACDLQIMGWKNDKKSLIEYFNPHKVVTRAEFGTVLSRFLYGDAHNWDTSSDWWYKAHLQALNADKIMKKIDVPWMNEIRGYVLIMLQRVYE